VIYACEVLRDFQAQGTSIRDDGFFDPKDDLRSDGEEAIEAVMKVAQVSYEERKLPHLGSLLALVAVDAGYDRGSANWMIRTAEELSWTQYVLLSLIPAPGTDKESLPVGAILTDVPHWNTWTVQRELADLGYGKRELVRWGQGHTERASIPFPSVEMSEMTLRHGGLLLHNALALADIDGFERTRVLDLLRERRPPSGSGTGQKEPPNP
jgi:hypothetical protein